MKAVTENFMSYNEVLRFVELGFSGFGVGTSHKGAYTISFEKIKDIIFIVCKQETYVVEEGKVLSIYQTPIYKHRLHTHLVEFSYIKDSFDLLFHYFLQDAPHGWKTKISANIDMSVEDLNEVFGNPKLSRILSNATVNIEPSKVLDVVNLILTIEDLNRGRNILIEQKYYGKNWMDVSLDYKAFTKMLLYSRENSILFVELSKFEKLEYIFEVFSILLRNYGYNNDFSFVKDIDIPLSYKHAIISEYEKKGRIKNIQKDRQELIKLFSFCKADLNSGKNPIDTLFDILTNIERV